MSIGLFIENEMTLFVLCLELINKNYKNDELHSAVFFCASAYLEIL